MVGNPLDNITGGPGGAGVQRATNASIDLSNAFGEFAEVQAATTKDQLEAQKFTGKAKAAKAVVGDISGLIG